MEQCQHAFGFVIRPTARFAPNPLGRPLERLGRPPLIRLWHGRSSPRRCATLREARERVETSTCVFIPGSIGPADESQLGDQGKAVRPEMSGGRRMRAA